MSATEVLRGNGRIRFDVQVDQVSDQPEPEQRLFEAWTASASPWTAAVREGRIGTRRRVTDAAVVHAVLARQPAVALDLGCGEGWLARALAASGVQVFGIDAVPELVAQATRAGGGTFRVMSYEELAGGALQERVDVAVANFALLGHRPVEALVRAVPSLLRPGGALVVQTVHPWVSCGEQPYTDGWREGSWDGFGPNFVVAPPWYFRTLASWMGLFAASGLREVALLEPVDPETGRPASALFIAEWPSRRT